MVRSLLFGLFVVCALATGASAQSFIIEAGNPVHLVGACNDDLYDSSIVIRNMTNAPLKVGAIYDRFGFGYRFSVEPPSSIAPLGTARVHLAFDAAHMDSSISRSTIKLYSGADTVLVPIDAVLKPYAVCAFGWQDVNMREVPVGETRCATYWGRNKSGKPITFYSVSFDHGQTSSVTITPKIPLPYVILPGEDLPLFDLCFSPTKTNEGASGRLSTSFSAYDCDDPAPLDFNFKSTTDSILLRSCLEFVSMPDLYGPTLIGGDSYDTIYIRSNRYSDITVDAMAFTMGDNTSFGIESALPMTISPLETKAIVLRFSPRETAPIVKYRYAANLSVQYHGDSVTCNPIATDIAALAMLPTADSIATPLLPETMYYLGMSGTAPSFSQDFHFTNNSSSNIKVVAVSLGTPAPEFAITNIQPTSSMPIILQPTDNLIVTVGFTPSKQNKIFYNTLVITTDVALQSTVFPLQALQLPSSGVGHIPAGTDLQLSISPNPFAAKAAIHFTLPQMSEVRFDICNVMGQVVAQIAGMQYEAGSYTFGFDAGNLPAGNYAVIMRAGNFSRTAWIALTK
jgi:hypothetical protein